MHKSLEKLYAGIEEAGTGRSGVGELSALASLSADLYTLVSVAPWLEEEYGTAREAYGRIRKVAAALVRALEEEPCILERIRGVHALFVLSNTAVDYEQKVLDLAEPLLALYETGYTGSDAALCEAEVCRLKCLCYCLIRDEKLSEEARAAIARWAAESEGDGTGSVLPDEVAYARSEAVEAYVDFTGNEEFTGLYAGLTNFRHGGGDFDSATKRTVENMDAEVVRLLEALRGAPCGTASDSQPVKSEV